MRRPMCALLGRVRRLPVSELQYLARISMQRPELRVLSKAAFGTVSRSGDRTLMIEGNDLLVERLNAMNLHLQLAQAQTRRQFLKNTGLGAIALATLLQRDGRAAPRQRQPVDAEAAALRPEGQKRHLPAHVRRSAAARPVRLQAEAGQELHMQAVPRRSAQEPALRLHQGHAEAARLAVQVQAARPERRLGQRTAAALQPPRR